MQLYQFMQQVFFALTTDKLSGFILAFKISRPVFGARTGRGNRICMKLFDFALLFAIIISSTLHASSVSHCKNACNCCKSIFGCMRLPLLPLYSYQDLVFRMKKITSPNTIVIVLTHIRAQFLIGVALNVFYCVL